MFRKLFLSLVVAFSSTVGLLSVPSAPVFAQQRFAPRFDTSKYPKARALVQQTSGFPNLKEFEILDPYHGKRYNCIAHSLGIHSRWVNPETGSASSPLALMDRMYRAKGYARVSGLDFRLAPGARKVVVYAHVSGGRITEVTHAAVQHADGTWSSKLGQLPLIRHRNPQAVAGPSYGQPVAVYIKR